MNNFLQTFSILVPVVVVIFLAWKEYRSGSSALRKDINSDYIERNQQLEEKLKIFELKLHEVSIQMVKLEATIIEKDKHIDSLTKLIENRNPELIVVLTEIREFMKSVKGLVDKNQIELVYQTELLDKQQLRADNIAKASANHTGDLTRIQK